MQDKMPVACWMKAVSVSACIMDVIATGLGRLLEEGSTPDKLRASAGPATICRYRKNNHKDETA
jgi:hypothetical protein